MPPGTARLEAESLHHPEAPGGTSTRAAGDGSWVTAVTAGIADI